MQGNLTPISSCLCRLKFCTDFQKTSFFAQNIFGHVTSFQSSFPSLKSYSHGIMMLEPNGLSWLSMPRLSPATPPPPPLLLHLPACLPHPLDRCTLKGPVFVLPACCSADVPFAHCRGTERRQRDGSLFKT